MKVLLNGIEETEMLQALGLEGNVFQGVKNGCGESD